MEQEAYRRRIKIIKCWIEIEKVNQLCRLIFFWKTIFHIFAKYIWTKSNVYLQIYSFIKIILII